MAVIESLSIAELRKFITDAGHVHDDCLEKSDLLRRAREVASAAFSHPQRHFDEEDSVVNSFDKEESVIDSELGSNIGMLGRNAKTRLLEGGRTGKPGAAGVLATASLCIMSTFAAMSGTTAA